MKAASAIVVTKLRPGIFQYPFWVWNDPVCCVLKLSYGPLTDPISACLVPCISGIKLQLLCGARIPGR